MTVDCAAVDFDLSADQQALRDAAAVLLDRTAGHDALRARVGTGAVVGTLPGAGDVRSRGRRRPRTARCADGDTTPRCGRPWPSRVGSPSSCPRTRGVSDSAWWRSPCSAKRSDDAWWRRPSCPQSWRWGRCAAPEARADDGTKEWREALSQGAAVGCVAYAPDTISVLGSGADVAAHRCIGTHRLRPLGRRGRGRAGGAVYAVDLRSEGRPDAAPGHGPHEGAGHPGLRRDAGPARGRGGRSGAARVTAPPRWSARRCSVRPTGCCR